MSIFVEMYALHIQLFLKTRSCFLSEFFSVWSHPFLSSFWFVFLLSSERMKKNEHKKENQNHNQNIRIRKYRIFQKTLFKYSI